VTVAGRTFSRQVPVLRCEKCGETYFQGNDLLEVEIEAAGVIAREGPSNGETFRFMRKALGLRAVDLAELLGVAPETLSRWENGQRPVDRAAWVALGAMAQERLEGRTTMLERLKALIKPSPLPKLVRLVPRHA
jgi:DNA-binding transcriptional regulator YiaG